MIYEPIDDTGRIVTSRKPKRCEWCGEWIQMGESAVIRVYKWDGDFHSEKVHPECLEALETAIDKHSGAYPYEFEKGANEKDQIYGLRNNKRK